VAPKVASSVGGLMALQVLATLFHPGQGRSRLDCFAKIEPPFAAQLNAV